MTSTARGNIIVITRLVVTMKKAPTLIIITQRLRHHNITLNHHMIAHIINAQIMPITLFTDMMDAVVNQSPHVLLHKPSVREEREAIREIKETRDCLAKKEIVEVVGLRENPAPRVKKETEE